MRRKYEPGLFSQSNATVSEETINVPQIRQKSDDKNWKNELIQMYGKSLIEQAQLQNHHYQIIYKWLTKYEDVITLTSSWQLELLTGEAVYLMRHISKTDHNRNNAAHYAIMAGAGSEVLAQIIKESPSLLLDKNYWLEDLLHFAYKFKNKSALEWLIEEVPIPNDSKLFNQKGAFDLIFWSKGIELDDMFWAEGLELLADLGIVLPLSLSLLEKHYLLPKTYKIQKEKKQFPFNAPIDFKSILDILSFPWDNPLFGLEWCRDNIPGFTDILQKARGSDGTTILHGIIKSVYKDDMPNRELFMCIAREVPELLEIKDDRDRSLAWFTIDSGCSSNSDIFNMVVSLQKDCSILDEVCFDFDESGDGMDSEDLECEAEDNLEKINNKLFHNYTTQTLRYTLTTKNLLHDYYTSSKIIPRYCDYLQRNKLLHLLFISRKDEDSIFNLYLNWDVMKIIIISLRALSPPPTELSLTSPASYIVQLYEDQISDCQEEEQDRTSEEEESNNSHSMYPGF